MVGYTLWGVHNGSWMLNLRDMLDAVKDYDYDLGRSLESYIETETVLWDGDEIWELEEENTKLEESYDNLEIEYDNLKAKYEELEKEVERLREMSRYGGKEV